MGLDNPLHIAFLLVILLLVFGAKRLPEIGRSLGGGLREFKQSISGETPGQSHEPQQPSQQQPTLPPGAVQAPIPPPAQQQPVPTPVPASAQATAQDAFAQRDPASTEQR
ncbi:MAG TPA: twin-arginine translocase TatA/TatE family subunit [Solirubrobacteraceae bacterium]